jgi:hypothetical protein
LDAMALSLQDVPFGVGTVVLPAEYKGHSPTQATNETAFARDLNLHFLNGCSDRCGFKSSRTD